MPRWRMHECGAAHECDQFEHPDRKKFGHTTIVPEHARKTSPIDAIQRAEERGLAELVMNVHAERYVGIGWPKVERIPISYNLRELDQEAVDSGDVVPHEWRVLVSVIAEPKS